jgi:hypothetical protein
MYEFVSAIYMTLSLSIYSNSCVDLQILMKFVIRILTKLYEIEISELETIEYHFKWRPSYIL